jgi:hypothetical protein
VASGFSRNDAAALGLSSVRAAALSACRSGFEDSFQRGFHVRGLESERPGRALMSNDAVSIDDVEPIWPRRVRTFDTVVRFVNEGGQLDTKLVTHTPATWYRSSAVLVVATRTSSVRLAESCQASIGWASSMYTT